MKAFRPPGATPVSLPSKRGRSAKEPTAPAPVPAEKASKARGSGLKPVWIVLGAVVLAAAGVAAGWFLTQ